MTSANVPTAPSSPSRSPLSRRRAVATLAGIGALGVVGAGRAAAQQQGAGQADGPATATAVDDATGPVVVASATGVASAPADRALIQLVVRSADYYGASGAPAEGADQGASTAPTKKALQAAVDVLTEAGVDKDQILTVSPDGGTASSFFGVGAGMVGAQLTRRQLKLLPDLVSGATSALTEQGLLVDQPTAAFLADGCSDVRTKALEAAVSAARADAEALAAALGATVTTLRRATNRGYTFGQYGYGGPGGTCDDLPELADLPRTYLGTYDPTAPADFIVTASIELVMDVE